MGEVHARVRVHGPRGFIELERVLVDTGATRSMVERTIAAGLGIPPERRTRFAVVGGKRELPAGLALLEIEGQSFRVPVVLGDRNLVGLTTLEVLGFAADPVEDELVPKPGIRSPARTLRFAGRRRTGRGPPAPSPSRSRRRVPEFARRPGPS